MVIELSPELGEVSPDCAAADPLSLLLEPDDGEDDPEVDSEPEDAEAFEPDDAWLPDPPPAGTGSLPLLQPPIAVTQARAITSSNRTRGERRNR